MIGMGHLSNLIATHPRIVLYAMVDAAVLPDLLAPLYALGRNKFACLLPGHVDADIAYVAPYLVALTPGSTFVTWLDAQCHLPWGYVVRSDMSLGMLQRHLRRFAETRGPRGEVWWFRFWDPRVLRDMPSVLDAAQMEAFIKGMDSVYLIDSKRGVVTGTWMKNENRIVFSDEKPATEGVIAHARV